MLNSTARYYSFAPANQSACMLVTLPARHLARSHAPSLAGVLTWLVC